MEEQYISRLEVLRGFLLNRISLRNSFLHAHPTGFRDNFE